MAAPHGLEFPSHLLNLTASSRFRVVSVNLTSRGMFTGKQLVDGPLFQIWQASFDLAALNREQWQELGAVLSEAYDNRTPFRIFDPRRQKPLGAFGNTGSSVGTPWGDDTTWGDGTLWGDEYFNGLVAAENAPQGRDSLLVNGAPPLQSRVCVKGDVFAVNAFLYEALNTADADALGRARIRVRPRLREHVQIGDQIIAGRATGSFYVKDPSANMIVRDSYTDWSRPTVEFIEALP